MSKQTAPDTIAPSKEIALPDGQLLDLNNVGEVARAYDDMQRYKRMIREVEGHLKEALLQYSSDAGQKTFTIADVAKVEIKGGNETRYDAQGLKRALKAAGMPEARIKEIVRETIEYKVSAVEAKRAARANEEYAKIIDEHATVEKKTPSVSVTRIGGKVGHPLAQPAGKDEMTASELPAPADTQSEAISAPADEDMPW